MAVIRSIQLIWFWAVKPATRWVLHLIDWQEGDLWLSDACQKLIGNRGVRRPFDRHAARWVYKLNPFARKKITGNTINLLASCSDAVPVGRGIPVKDGLYIGIQHK